MWNISKPFNPTGSFLGPNFGPNFKVEKRDFSFNLPDMTIAPGKSFKNPNFVINHYPSVHSNTPDPKIGHTPVDKQEPVNERKKEKSDKNSSRKSKEPFQENFDESSTEEILVENNQMCSSKKSFKNNKRSPRKKVPKSKNSKQNNSKRQISEMMEFDFDLDISVSNSDSNTLPTVSPSHLNLADFILDVPKKQKTSDELFTFLSKSSTIIDPFSRERNLSVSESEDSFIVFDEGTDVDEPPSRDRKMSVSESEDSFIGFDKGPNKEQEFSEDSDDNIEFGSVDDADENDTNDDSSDDEEPDINDEIDSSQIVPSKRVRFSEESLCEIHPMVQWSFAYHKARKGPWEEYARDRARFNRRIYQIGTVLSPIFDRDHREHVYKERFQGNCGKETALSEN